MHIGRETSLSKTKCIFSPPQLFQQAQRRNAAAGLIQCVPHHASTSTHPHQLIKQPAPSSNSPKDFPVGCRIVVASSHPAHANKGGTVCRLTQKYVMFSPDNTPTDIICILPKSLATYHPKGQQRINSADNDDKHDPGQTKCKHAIYDKLDETQNFPVAVGFVSFTRTYLGSLISCNLPDNDDITSLLAAANASMSKLKEV
jgi:hypothetical protein